MSEPMSLEAAILSGYAAVSGVLSVLISVPFFWFFAELPFWMRAVAVIILGLGIIELRVAYRSWKARE